MTITCEDGTLIVVQIPPKGPDADPPTDHIVEVKLNRCPVPWCQRLLPAHRKYCSDAHRAKFNRDYLGQD